ncbi:hypothetical protein, partial [Escherichia coli]|uniref:hypothetical protein n=2 Tax=Escherichia coli TaxID=562 RepID=UPI001BDB7658
CFPRLARPLHGAVLMHLNKTNEPSVFPVKSQAISQFPLMQSHAPLNATTIKCKKAFRMNSLHTNSTFKEK